MSSSLRSVCHSALKNLVMFQQGFARCDGLEIRRTASGADVALRNIFRTVYLRDLPWSFRFKSSSPTYLSSTYSSSGLMKAYASHFRPLRTKADQLYIHLLAVQGPSSWCGCRREIYMYSRSGMTCHFAAPPTSEAVKAWYTSYDAASGL